MNESNSTSQLIAIDEITIGERLTPISQPYVERLVASIEEIGLLQPIVLREYGSGYLLIAGAHRLAAYRALGWNAIEARVIEASEAIAAIAEIDENLIRRGLSAFDEGVSLRERKAFYEAAFPDARHGGDRRKKKQEGTLFPLETKRFTRAVADKVGWSERTIKKRLQLANSLDPEAVHIARETGLIANESQMLKLAGYTPTEQVKLMKAVRDNTRSTIGQAEHDLGWKVAKPAQSYADKLAAAFGSLLITAELVQLEAMKRQLDAAIIQKKRGNS